MVDVGLIVYLTAWYLGNYYYNIFNKTAAKAGGGSEYAMIMAWIQMAVGAVYALALCVCLPAPGPALSPSCGSASWPRRGLSGVGPTGAPRLRPSRSGGSCQRPARHRRSPSRR